MRSYHSKTNKIHSRANGIRYPDQITSLIRINQQVQLRIPQGQTGFTEEAQVEIYPMGPFTY